MRTWVSPAAASLSLAQPISDFTRASRTLRYRARQRTHEAKVVTLGEPASARFLTAWPLPPPPCAEPTRRVQGTARSTIAPTSSAITSNWWAPGKPTSTVALRRWSTPPVTTSSADLLANRRVSPCCFDVRHFAAMAAGLRSAWPGSKPFTGSAEERSWQSFPRSGS